MILGILLAMVAAYRAMFYLLCKFAEWRRAASGRLSGPTAVPSGANCATRFHQDELSVSGTEG